MSKSGNYSSILKAGISILLFCFSAVPQLQAQSFDHEKHPKLDFDFTSLELDLGLQPQNLRFDGAARYSIKANVSQADTVILYAAHIDISSVTVGGNQADYMLHNDSLFVPIDQQVERGQEFELNIRYSGSPRFGFLKNVNGTVWTSLLPQTQRHWVPIVDNPNVRLKTTFNISVPSGYSVWATGRKTGEEVVSVDAVTYHYSTEKEVPASSLALSIVRFDQDSMKSEHGQINMAVEQNLSDSIATKELLQSADEYMSQISDSVGQQYPYEQLHIVVMEDHNWETKSWGASSVYLYHNRGNWQAQLLRGIIGQWIGVYQQETQWSQGDAINLYQTILQQSLSKEENVLSTQDIPQNSLSTVYANFSPQRWNAWQQGFGSWQSESVRTVIAEAKDSLLTKLPRVISWDDYAEYWYQQSGQPIFEMPGFGTVSTTDTSGAESQPKQQTTDSVAYEVVYNLNEEDGQLKLRFSATQGVFNDLTTLDVQEVYSGKTESGEVTFTGAQDSVIINVSPMISTVRLEIPENTNLHLDEYKPASFLIYELRNAETVEQRAEAAGKLGFHQDNPDLQLAIKDFMNKETEPKVTAALLSSLAEITQGAAGTEQIFLDALDSDSREVRNAALMALQHYSNNPSIVNRVEQLALNGNLEMFRNATKVLTAIAGPKQFQSYVDNITQQDTTGHRSIYAIQQLANLGEVGQAVKMANLFTGQDYAYNTRNRAIQILIQHDHTPADWLSRADQLLADPDPRIRFLTVVGLQRNLNPKVTEYLKEYIQDEYDARVYKKIEQLIQ